MTAAFPNHPAVDRPPSPSQGHWILGGFLVIAGVLLLLVQAGITFSPWPAFPALLLVVLGGAVVVQGLRGAWHPGLATAGVILTVITAVGTTTTNAWPVLSTSAGDRSFAPGTIEQLQDRYELGAGTLLLDLRDIDMPEGTTSVAASVGMGEVDIRVPEGVGVSVTARDGAGEIALFGEVQGGLGVNRTYTTPGYDEAARRLEFDIDVGMGRIEVGR